MRLWVFGGAGWGRGQAGRGAPRPGAPAPGLGAGIARRGEGGSAGRAAGGSRARSGRARPRGARRRARGAEGVCGRGPGWASGLSSAGGETRLRCCPAPGRSGVVGARSGAAEVWESKKDRVPGEEECAGEKRDLPEQAGVSASRADPTPRWRLENFFLQTYRLPNVGGPRLPGRRAGRLPLGGGRGARGLGVVRAAAAGLGVGVGGRLSGVRWEQWSEKGFAGRRETLRWGDTGVNSGGSPEEAGEKRAPPGPGCCCHGTLRSGVVCCYSYVLVTVIWLLLKMRANSDCDH